MSSAPVLTFNPNSFTIDGCSQCPLVLNNLATAFLAQGVVEQDGSTFTLVEWQQMDPSNREYAILADGTVVFNSSSGAVDCDALVAFAFTNGVWPNCEQRNIVLQGRLTDLTASAEVFADMNTLVTEVPNPVLGYQPGDPVCDVAQFETQTFTLADNLVASFAFNQGVVSVSQACGEMTIQAVETASVRYDCNENETLADDYACRFVTFQFTVALTNCPDKQATLNVVVLQVGNPCFCCPPNRCSVKSCDFDATLADLKQKDEQSILASATNGCGQTVFNKTVTCSDRVLCNRCCRGEMSIERTWTLTNDDCTNPVRSRSCAQRIRLVNCVLNKRWQRYFPCPNGPCNCSSDV